MSEVKKYYKPPFRYDAEGGYIWDSENNMIAEVRGFGHLQDEVLQDKLGELIAEAVTAYWNTRAPRSQGVGEVKEEIEQMLMRGRTLANGDGTADDNYYQGFNRACEKILSLLSPESGAKDGKL